MDGKRSKVVNAQQGKFGSQWLRVVPCKNLGLKLDDHQLRFSIGLRLGANICVAEKRHCGNRVEPDGLHGLSSTKSAGRFSRHATLNSLIKQREREDLILRFRSTKIGVTEKLTNTYRILAYTTVTTNEKRPAIFKIKRRVPKISYDFLFRSERIFFNDAVPMKVIIRSDCTHKKGLRLFSWVLDQG